MKKSKGGRKPIEVIESLPLSQIIFLISAGINYPEAISKARQTDSSATIKQLSILETKEFVSWKKSEDKLLNKTIYFVKWEKVIEEFMKKLNWQKDRVLEQAKQTNSDYETKFNQQITYFKYFEDKDFLDMLPKNIYLQKYLSVYFSQMPSINMSYTISDLLGYILLVGNFNFVSFGNLNISRVAHFIEQQNAKEIPADIIGIPEKDWHEIDKKKFEQQLKEQAKNIGKSFESSYNKAEKRIKEIQEKDLQLRQLTILQIIFSALQYELTLQIPLNNATMQTADFIARKNFTEEEVKKTLDAFNFLDMRPKTAEEIKTDSNSSKP